VIDKRYLHLSFDCWKTLIRSHPAYKAQRSAYFQELFNPSGLSVMEVDLRVRKVEKMVDRLVEMSGQHVYSVHIIGMILNELSYPIDTLSHADLSSISGQLQAIFFNYLPDLYDEHTKETLYRLRDEGYTLSILSNTALVPGSDIKVALKELGIYRYFSFMYFSDEQKIAKPHFMVFDMMAAHAVTLPTHPTKKEILHIGDNFITDVRGPASAGIDAFRINTNDKTIKDLL
jgi:putative hydrolase of the HAD superfamily